MSVLNIKYVVFSFSYRSIYMSIGSDHRISILTSVECLPTKDVCYLIFC